MHEQLPVPDGTFRLRSHASVVARSSKSVVGSIQLWQGEDGR